MQVVLYPNPSNGIIHIAHESNLIKQIWLIEANCDKSILPDNHEDVIASLNFSNENLDNNSVYSIEITNPSTFLSVDLSTYGEGLFKLFILNNEDELNWYNLYVDPSATHFPDLSFTNDLCD